jgi:hypothetical protein
MTERDSTVVLCTRCCFIRVLMALVANGPIDHTGHINIFIIWYFCDDRSRLHRRVVKQVLFDSCVFQSGCICVLVCLYDRVCVAWCVCAAGVAHTCVIRVSTGLYMACV